VSPTYGVTKNPRDLNLTISGENFDCPSGGDCSGRIRVRFTNDKGDEIYQDGWKEGQNIKTRIPRYPSPETLTVDISMNGQDFTNNKVTYGFMDPYILQVNPRIFAPSGGWATMNGYGFVKMDDSKSKVSFYNSENAMTCTNPTTQVSENCTAVYEVIDEHTIKVKVPEQKIVNAGGEPIKYQPWTIAMMDMDGEYSNTNIKLYYYNEF